MKKFLKVIATIVILFIAALFIVPIIFKDDLVQLAKEQANKNLNARVEFGDFDLSLIADFPNFSFFIKDVDVANIDTFEGIHLAKIGELKLVVDLNSVISGGAIGINTIEIHNPTLHAKVLRDGSANWDIAKTSEETEVEEETSEEPTDFQMKLKNFSITNANIVYDDASMDLNTNIKNFNFQLGGDFTASTTDITSKTIIEAITVEMEGIKFLNQASIDIKADLAADLDKMKFTFKENEFKINEIVLGMNGWLQMLEEAYDMDLTFNTSETSFKSVLSMVPAVYMHDFAGVETKGSFGIKGMAKGKYYEEGDDLFTPEYGINFFIRNSMFKYPDLPSSVDNINLDLDIKSKGGDLDNMIMNMGNFHMELAGNAFDMGMELKTPISDPFIAAHFDGKIDMDKIKDIVPLEDGDKLGGIIESNIKMQGNMSTIEAEKYEEFEASGALSISNMDYTSTELPYDVLIENMKLVFSPKSVELANFTCNVGNSDFHASGQLTNFIPYALSDSQELGGKLKYWSNFIDINEFLEDDSASLAYEAAVERGEIIEEALEVYPLPDNMHFVMDAKIKDMQYGDMHILNTTGKVEMRHMTATMSDVVMNMLGGKVLMSGIYETTNPANPTMDYLLDMQNVSVKEMAETFNTVESMAPVMKKCTGTMSTKFYLKGTLDNEYMPVLNTLTGKGNLKTNTVSIADFKPLTILASAIKNDDLSPLALSNVSLIYKFEDGKITTEPFDVKLKNSKLTLKGWNGFDESMEWIVTYDMPASKLKGSNPAIDKFIDAMGPGERVKVPAKIHGTATDPKVSVAWDVIKADLKNRAGSVIKDKIISNVKDQVTEKVETVKKDAKEVARKKADQILATAQKQADKVRSEGKKAAQGIRNEGKVNGQKLIDEAGNNPIKKKVAEKAAQGVRNKANSKADKVEQTANEKADQIMAKARKEADELLK